MDNILSITCFIGFVATGAIDAVDPEAVRWLLGLAFAAGTLWFKVNKIENIIKDLDLKYVRRAECGLIQEHRKDEEGSK